MGRADAPLLQVDVVYCARAGEVDQVSLMLPSPACVRDALQSSGLLVRHPDIDLERQRVGVWGRLRTLDAPLRDRDRVEIYRPLLVDPKEARRRRHARQRAG
jgi:uncharacterized protein